MPDRTMSDKKAGYPKIPGSWSTVGAKLKGYPQSSHDLMHVKVFAVSVVVHALYCGSRVYLLPTARLDVSKREKPIPKVESHILIEIIPKTSTDVPSKIRPALASS